ncbi:MAG: hypothetical protein HC796_02415 [Synechococcaceae cyanobacterium RL_1_2]|nr:hypothetical protein [Synechococcaceae cyanobacterium RL_1_2]
MKPDDNLKKFLQQYRPELPPACPSQEKQLMAQIAQTQQSGAIPWKNFITIGAAIVGLSLTVGWWFNPPRRFAHNAIDSLALEAFLMDTWSGSVQRETLNHEQPLNEQWLTLINP